MHVIIFDATSVHSSRVRCYFLLEIIRNLYLPNQKYRNLRRMACFVHRAGKQFLLHILRLLQPNYDTSTNFQRSAPTDCIVQFSIRLNHNYKTTIEHYSTWYDSVQTGIEYLPSFFPLYFINLFPKVQSVFGFFEVHIEKICAEFPPGWRAVEYF